MKQRASTGMMGFKECFPRKVIAGAGNSERTLIARRAGGLIDAVVPGYYNM